MLGTCACVYVNDFSRDDARKRGAGPGVEPIAVDRKTSDLITARPSESRGLMGAENNSTQIS